MTRYLTYVSEDLKSLADGSSQNGRALHELADKLNRPDRSDLAGADLAAMYSPTVMLPEGPRWGRGLANSLELIRDILIFVPVIYTWWQISEALRAYNHYTGTAPFLLAWQEGFGNRTQRLSTSAIVVAAVVLAVILLTVIAHVVRTWYDQQVQRQQQRLAVLLAEAAMLLMQSAVAAPDVTRAELAKIGAHITGSAEALQQSLGKASSDITAAVNTSPGSKLHEMFEKWTAAADELRTLGTRLQNTQEVVSQLRDTQNALSGMANQIGNDTSRLLTAMESERSLVLQEAHARHDLATEVGQATRLLGDSLRGLNERAEQFNEIVLRLDFVVQRLEQNGNYAEPGGGYS